MAPAPRTRTLLAWSCTLFAFNAWLVHELFFVEWLDQMGSIEGSFIAISRYMADQWRDLSWFPLWYGGIPFQNTYPPLLHSIVALSAALTGASTAHAYHAVTAFFYCLGSVTLFLLVYRLGKNLYASVLAGLVYSVLSPSAFLVADVRRDVGGLFYPRRFQDLVQYGEGPHIAALALLPLAILALDRALERRRPVNFVLAAVICCAVLLTNYLGAFALAVMVVCYLLARGQHGTELWRTPGVPQTALVSLGAYGLAAPWLPPSTLQVVQRNAQIVGGTYPMGLIQIAFIVGGLALLWAVAWFFPGRFWLLAALAFCGIALPAMWFGKFVLPQPERYHLEMEMALCAVIVLALFGLLPRWAATGLLLLLCAYPALQVRRFARQHIRAFDITATVEYRMGRWIAEHLPGERVSVPGSIYIWLNAFGAQPQLAGGFDQGITNQLFPAVSYQLTSGMNAETGEGEADVAIAWLHALGVSAIAVGGPKSREAYKPFRNPHKFEGRLEEIWREGDDVVYRLPGNSESLAHVMTRADLPASVPGIVTPARTLAPYLAALDDPTYLGANISWPRPGAMTITAGLKPGQLISIQASYDPGWEARVGIRPAKIQSDAIGQMIIEPACSGACVVEMEYTGGLEMKLAKTFRLLAIAGGLLWIIRGRRA